MEQSFWEARWQAGQIGFHLDAVNPALTSSWPELVGQAPILGTRVLVPLCGKSQDLTWLNVQGHDVVGVEFVETAAQAFFEEQHLTPERHETSGGTRYSWVNTAAAAGIEIHVGDFFKVRELECGRCDWVYDRAALVAIAPERRGEYVAKLASLTKPGAGLLLISFEHDTGSGPPFSIPPAEVHELFDAHFDLREHRTTDVLAAEPRFKDRGATFMKEQCYLGRRR